MILTCPACGTQYVVKDGAIPDGGRKVRCASCRHSWHQEAPPLELEEEAAPKDLAAEQDHAAAEAAAPPPEPEIPDPSHPEIRSGDYDDAPQPAEGAREESGYGRAAVGEHPAYAEPYDRVPDEADEEERALSVPQHEAIRQPEPRAEPQPPAEEYVEDDFSPFAAREPEERRRRSPLIAVLLVVVLVGALAAAFWFLAPPEWKARVGLTQVSQTPLQLMMTHSDRQALESGNELLAVSGRVINPTTRSQPVPPIQAELRSKAGEVVYRWTIAPPTATLAPGASARFNSAEVNVPAGGEELTVSLGAPGA